MNTTDLSVNKQENQTPLPWYGVSLIVLLKNQEDELELELPLGLNEITCLWFIYEVWQNHEITLCVNYWA
jgi:hypothetical protein